MTCQIIDAGTDWRCLTHDIQVEPLLVDAYTTNPTPADYWCPVHTEYLLPRLYEAEDNQ